MTPTPIPLTLCTLAEECGVRIGAAANVDGVLDDPLYRELFSREVNALTTEGYVKFADCHSLSPGLTPPPKSCSLQADFANPPPVIRNPPGSKLVIDNEGE